MVVAPIVMADAEIDRLDTLHIAGVEGVKQAWLGPRGSRQQLREPRQQWTHQIDCRHVMRAAFSENDPPQLCTDEGMHDEAVRSRGFVDDGADLLRAAPPPVTR